MIATVTALEEAVAIIEDALRALGTRENISTAEMTDILLDARQKLATAD